MFLWILVVTHIILPLWFYYGIQWEQRGPALVPWFFGPWFLTQLSRRHVLWHSFWRSCHDVMCCDVMKLIHTVNRPKNAHRSLNLLTDFGMIAEGNHFNNMIFVISRTCRYVFKKRLHISVQKKMIKLWHNTGVTHSYQVNNC